MLRPPVADVPTRPPHPFGSIGTPRDVVRDPRGHRRDLCGLKISKEDKFRASTASRPLDKVPRCEAEEVHVSSMSLPELLGDPCPCGTNQTCITPASPPREFRSFHSPIFTLVLLRFSNIFVYTMDQGGGVKVGVRVRIRDRLGLRVGGLRRALV